MLQTFNNRNRKKIAELDSCITLLIRPDKFLSKLYITIFFAINFYPFTGGGGGERTYVMITYVSKENNLGRDHKIRYIWGLKGPIFIL